MPDKSKSCRYVDGKLLCDKREWVEAYRNKLDIPFGGSIPERRRSGTTAEKVYMNDQLSDADYIDDREERSFSRFNRQMKQHIGADIFDNIENPQKFNASLNQMSDERIRNILADYNDINWGTKIGECRTRCTWLEDESILRMAGTVQVYGVKSMKDMFVMEMAVRIRMKRSG